MQKASHSYARQSIKKNIFKVIPGWNRRVNAKHNIARVKFLGSIHHGRARGTVYHEEMVRSRSDFKKALQECKAHEQR